MSHRQPIDWKVLATQFGNCSWAVIDGHVTVRSVVGSRTAKIAGLAAESLAGLLMWEMANEQQRC